MRRLFQIGLLTLVCALPLGVPTHARRQSLCLEHELRGDVAAKPCDLSNETLICTEWRVYSLGFSIVPAEGYPIEFLPNGELRTDNLAAMKRWQVDSPGIISLRTIYGELGEQFVFDPGHCMLVSFQCDRARSIPTLIGPKGTDFFGYLASTCPSRFGSIALPAAPN